MSAFTLRDAQEQDFPAIRRLIHQVGINPMALDWRRFVVAVDSTNRLLGCGQLKPHGKFLELASIAVQPQHRSEGIARAIIELLLQRGPRPLYLMCRAQLGPFYQKWGFRAIGRDDMPPYFKRMARLASMFAPMTAEGDGLLVMELM